VGDGGVGEAMVVMGASTMGRGMFSMGMSSNKMWSVMSPMS